MPAKDVAGLCAFSPFVCQVKEGSGEKSCFCVYSSAKFSAKLTERGGAASGMKTAPSATPPIRAQKTTFP